MTEHTTTQTPTTPELKGTPRQVEWAETIRRDLLDRLDWPSIAPETADVLKHEADSHNDAQWWMEHRTSTDTILANDYMARELGGQVAYDGIPAVLGGGYGNMRVERTVDGGSVAIYQTNGVAGFRVSSTAGGIRYNSETPSILTAVETAKDFIENGVIHGEPETGHEDGVRSAEERRRIRRARMRRE